MRPPADEDKTVSSHLCVECNRDRNRNSYSHRNKEKNGGFQGLDIGKMGRCWSKSINLLIVPDE